jgi:glycosyltransferase involved in cell wall biosynthesis
MKIDIAITTYNRESMTKNAIEQVLNDERVNSIIIADDASTDGSFHRLSNYYRNNDKVVLFQQYKNVNMSKNKADAVAHCTMPLVCLWDSDNTFSPGYLDALYAELNGAEPDAMSGTIFCPEWARPSFDYREFASMSFTKENAKGFMDNPMFRCMCNTANYVVPREAYCKVYRHDPSILASDTIFFNYLWLKAGGSLYVVPGMQYDHLQHSESGFLKDLNENMKKVSEIEKMIIEL